MKLILGSRKRGKWVIKVILSSCLIYVVALLVNQQVCIREKRCRINEMTEQLSLQENKNQKMQEELDAGESTDSRYIESSARENLKFSKSGERVYVNVAGK